jgi:hypothetical protein
VDRKPGLDERTARERCSVAADAIVTGVARHLPGYLVSEAGRVLDAWGLAGPGRTRADAAVAGAADAATTRVIGALRALFTLDPAEQRATPLEVVRTATREPTEVLREVGVPPVVRDEFDERHLPDDDYDLTPRAVGDLGDPDLGPELLAWGLAKTRVLRARS